LGKLVIIIFTLFVSVSVIGQQRPSVGHRELEQVVVKMFEALSKRDSIALKSSCTPDVTFYEYGQIWNLDSLIRKAIKTNQSVDFRRTNSFDFIYVESDETSAWLTYHLTSVITRDSKETVFHWLETVVLAIQNKQWKVKHLHSTLIKRG
jgi:hypothetical protein